ncbi:MFS transporter [Alkalibacterium iburiense]|uniref:MFS transporter n=1 Tax=Alkalibacterium iburiense TaxID=290589 RepID=A0ABP3H706_9LACT
MRNKSSKHWIVMLTLCGVAISAVGLPVMTNGVFIQPIADSLGVYRGTVSVHNTMTLLLKAVMSLYAPRLIRRYTFKKAMIIGTLLAGLSNYFLGWTNQIWLFNVLGTIRGIGTGMLAWVPLTIVINEWFSEKHGLVTSIVLSFSSITGAIFSPIFTSLIQSLGWAQSYRIMGLLIILFALPIILVPFTVNPRESGYLPYGLVEKGEKDSGQARTVIRREEGVEVSTLLFSLLFIFTLLQTMLIGVPQHFPGFSGTVGWQESVGATMLSIAMISSIGFKLGLGYISDIIGPVKSTVSILSFVGLASILLMLTRRVPILYIAAFFYGSIYAIPSVSVTLLTKEFFGRYHFTRLYPILAFSTSLGGAISLSLVGFIYDFTGSYVPAFAGSLVINIINICVLLYLNKATPKRR